MAARQRSRSIQQAPEWGIEPVPPDLRRLGFLDQAVLWGNLGISLLVLVAGALLVPALGLWPALAATVVGAVVGNALLGLAAVPAAATGVPAMVLYRAPLGVRGSLLPTACNVVQNLGWATFELFVIASAATAISARVFGVGARPLRVLGFGVLATAMAVAGPLTVLRRWLQRFAVWAVLASTAYLNWSALTRLDPGFLTRRAGHAGRALVLARGRPRRGPARLLGAAGRRLRPLRPLGRLDLLGHGPGLPPGPGVVLRPGGAVPALHRLRRRGRGPAGRAGGAGGPGRAGGRRDRRGLRHPPPARPSWPPPGSAPRPSCPCPGPCSCPCSGPWPPPGTCSPAAATTSRPCTGRMAPTGGGVGRRGGVGCAGS